MASKKNLQTLLRAVPAVNELIGEPALVRARARWGHDAVVAAAREVLDELRGEIRRRHAEGDGADAKVDAKALASAAAERAGKRSSGGVRRAINATGVILHTGLGRAVLPEQALKDLAAECAGYAAVEVDLASGARGKRDTAAGELLRTLLGCEDATVVNNNAAATMLALAALARGREVIVSRGQLVEIGGSFRMPDVMKESGATLVEVGATNRTRVEDYRDAITPQTALLLAVHPSNFRMIGFTEEVPVAELVKLGRRYSVPVVYDIGSGALLPNLAKELKEEPVVKSALDAGVDLVLFSGDKILGGPQAGIAAGKKALVEKLRSHPLYRAFRLDKLILRALESTLALYLDPKRRNETLPTLRMLTRSLKDLESEAKALAKQLAAANKALSVDTAEDSSRLGSGSLPEHEIPTVVVRLKHKTLGAEALAARLRAHEPPILGRIQDDRLLLDPRTLLAGEADEIARALKGIK